MQLVVEGQFKHFGKDLNVIDNIFVDSREEESSGRIVHHRVYVEVFELIRPLFNVLSDKRQQRLEVLLEDSLEGFGSLVSLGGKS